MHAPNKRHSLLTQKTQLHPLFGCIIHVIDCVRRLLFTCGVLDGNSTIYDTEKFVFIFYLGIGYDLVECKCSNSFCMFKKWNHHKLLWLLHG